MKIPTLIQAIFYSFIFVSGFLYQPNWAYDNFWAKADIYDSIPFNVPFFVFLFIYSSLLTLLVWVFVKFAKSRL
jgi:hypothetical protein